MSQKPPAITYKGRSLGIIILTVAQLLIGIIHVASGLWLLTYELSAGTAFSLVYDFYTLAFGLSIFVFAVYVWRQKWIGWAGTIAASLFVIAVDSLAVLNLPTIPGVPQGPALTEIGYSVIIVAYLLTDVRKKFQR